MHHRMAKLTVLAATVMALFAVAAAIDFRTPFTTTTIFQMQEDKEPKCEKQIQKQLHLFSCQRYLLKSTKMTPPSMLDNQGSTWREDFPQCCDQLEKIAEKCKCQAIERALKQLKEESEEGALEGVNIEEMLETARSLPNICRLKPEYCYIPSDIYERM